MEWLGELMLSLVWRIEKRFYFLFQRVVELDFIDLIEFKTRFHFWISFADIF